mmetsp:Transcript_16884/g.39273  ORF Transcript_16884/g.39273 Transcript_16884/m.39273 type:complete len:111 (-) Transcript_16884:492-824(-)
MAARLRILGSRARLCSSLCPQQPKVDTQLPRLARTALLSTAGAPSSRPFQQFWQGQSRTAVNVAANVKVGDAIPDVSLDKGFPPEPFKLKEYCKGKKVILVGLPGAFTPT